MVRGVGAALVWMASAWLAPGCGPGAPAAGEGGVPQAMTAKLRRELEVVAGARILFVHHSVGVNILAGMTSLSAEAGVPLRMAELGEATELEGPVLAHGGGGRNTDPRSKIDAFASLIRGQPRLAPDLAFLKLCYVDFEPTTDVPQLFDHYRRTLQALQREHPEVRFAHATVPLFRRSTDLRATVKRLLGREVWEDAANARRAEYNQLLRAAFPGDPILDVAGAESTAPDGGAVTGPFQGRAVPALHPGYTDDGGHLNAAGQRAVGLAAVELLARALAGRGRGP